jgi:hypothetical protein
VEESIVNRAFLLMIALLFLVQSACGPRPRSKQSFDQIRESVSGKTAAEVARLLGPPDKTEKLLLGDERWIWWNYTYLGGKDWAPEVRGRVVHLEITFEGPAFASEAGNSTAAWRVSEPYGVGFSMPGGEDETRSLSLNKKARSRV